MDENRVEESVEVEDVMEQAIQEETEVKEVEKESLEVVADETEVADEKTEVADEKAEENDETKVDEEILAEKIVETDDDDCGFIESKEFVNKSSLKEETKENVQVENVGKKKIKEEKPPTKVIIRNLPPAMTEKEFSEAISPIPAYDFFYYVKAEQSTDRSLQAYSRAYINFIDPDNVHFFYDTFDNYVFVDSKGYEYPAQVELAPYQKIQRKNRRRDKLIGLIETDQSYIAFKEMYELESSETVANKQHFLETEIAPVEEITTTPLIEFMKQKRAEKARLKDEKREERKRKENERRQKQQKFREKREGEEEVAKDIKIQSESALINKKHDVVTVKSRETLEEMCNFKFRKCRYDSSSRRGENAIEKTKFTATNSLKTENEQKMIYLKKLIGISEMKSQDKTVIISNGNVNPSLPLARFKNSRPSDV